MPVEMRSSDYSQKTFALLNSGIDDFTQASWNQDEQDIQYPFYRFGEAPGRPDSASVDSVPPHTKATQETLPTTIKPGGPEVEYIDDELEEDVLLAFPPRKKYVVDLTITKITKWKLRLVGTEDLL